MKKATSIITAMLITTTSIAQRLSLIDTTQHSDTVATLATPCNRKTFDMNHVVMDSVSGCRWYICNYKRIGDGIEFVEKKIDNDTWLLRVFNDRICVKMYYVHGQRINVIVD